MTYRIYWDEMFDDILHSHLTGPIEWDDYHQMVDAMLDSIQEIDRNIYFIVHAEVPPPKGNPLPHLRQTIRKINEFPQLQLAISVDEGMATLLRLSFEVLIKIYSPNWNNKLPFVQTMDQALHLIKIHRQNNNQNTIQC